MADLPSITDAAAAPAPAAQPAAEPAAAPQAAQAVELDGLSEFTFQGQKYNPESFHKIFQEHQSFSKEAAAYKEEKQFVDNLQIDLENVLNDPKLADRFKAVYPKKYHTILDRYLASGGQAPAQAPNNAQPSLPKEFQTEFNQMKERLNFHEQRAYQAEVQANSAKLDSLLPPLFAKYDMANEDQVYSKAEALLASGQKLTDKTWERLVRESHEVTEKKADQRQAAIMKKQIEAGKKGQDVGSGGATPGAAPKKIRTFAEAQAAMIESMQRKNA